MIGATAQRIRVKARPLASQGIVTLCESTTTVAHLISETSAEAMSARYTDYALPEHPYSAGFSQGLVPEEPDAWTHPTETCPAHVATPHLFARCRASRRSTPPGASARAVAASGSPDIRLLMAYTGSCTGGTRRGATHREFRQRLTSRCRERGSVDKKQPSDQQRHNDNAHDNDQRGEHSLPGQPTKRVGTGVAAESRRPQGASGPAGSQGCDTQYALIDRR